MPADKVAGDSIAKRRYVVVECSTCKNAIVHARVRVDRCAASPPSPVFRVLIGPRYKAEKKKFPRGVYTRGYLSNSTLDDSSVSSQQEEGEDEEEEEEEDVC